MHNCYWGTKHNSWESHELFHKLADNFAQYIQYHNTFGIVLQYSIRSIVNKEYKPVS